MDQPTRRNIMRLDQNLSISATQKDAPASSMLERKLFKQCCEFEAVMLGHMLSSMRRAMATEGGLFGHSGQDEIYRALFDEEVAKSVSESANLGIARLLFRELSPLVKQTAKPGS